MPVSANGSTLFFPATSSVGAIEDIKYHQHGVAIDASNLLSAVKVVEAGIKDQECTVVVKGHPNSSVAYGVTGALTITWNDTTVTDTIGTAVCMGVETSGAIDGAIKSTLTFRPHL